MKARYPKTGFGSAKSKRWSCIALLLQDIQNAGVKDQHEGYMTEHLKICKHVGWTLIVIGVIDVGFMIYCIIHEISYSSSLNIFAVVAGILLLRGSLGTARIVAWFSAFMFAGLLLGSVIVFPWMRPLDYWLLTFYKNPLGSLLSIVVAAVLLFWLFWVYRNLRSPAVLEARAAIGQRVGVPRSAFIAGSALTILMAVLLQLSLKGESAEKAVRLATQQHGSQYKYFVSSINWAGHHVSARLTAYNEKASKKVLIEWEE
jgi:hypothetical protein